MGRNIKLNNNFLEATKEVLSDQWNSLLLDSDLLFFVNDKLQEADQISHDTLERYINKTNKNETLKIFCGLIKKARSIQKKNLINELRKTDKGWQRFAWLLERKYSNEYNLKQEHNHTIEPITINFNFGVQKKELSKSTQKLILNN